MNGNLGIPVPGFKVTISISSKQPISFDTVSERIITGDDDLAKHI